MRILIIGAAGQLGQALVQVFGESHELLTPSRQELDITDYHAQARIEALQPELVVLTAAYTDVDGCARDPQRAFQANTLGPKYVALACRSLDIPLVYVSTNEVFDGFADQPYGEYDPPNPINPYGYSKWGGEQAVIQHLQRFYIVRVAWLFGGKRNFVKTVLRLAEERPELAMVEDEFGSPTFALDAARAIASLVETGCYGVYHIVNEGQCSRYEFAQEILRLAGRAEYPLRPIALVEYRRASTPPPFTPLRNSAAAALGIRMRPWQEALADYVSRVLNEGSQPAHD